MRTPLKMLTLLVILFSAVTFADYYTDLEITKDATADEISRAYRRLAIRYHPDKNPDDKAAAASFKIVAAAYEVLSDLAKRELYDAGNWSEEAAQASRSADTRDSSGRRPESGFYDPTGIQTQNNQRLNFLNDTYVEMRKTMSAPEALIATLKKERGVDRPKNLMWGRQYGNEIYESQTQYVFGEFMKEIMNDLFYTTEPVRPPSASPQLKGSTPKTTVATKGTQLALSRYLTLEQFEKINSLYGGEGNYEFTKRAIQEARNQPDLYEMFHQFMSRYWKEDYLYHPDAANHTNVHDTRKVLVNILAPAVRRIQGEDAPVSEMLADFLRTRLSRMSPTDRQMARNLTAVIGSIDTREAYEALSQLTKPGTNGFLQGLANEAIGKMDPKTLAIPQTELAKLPANEPAAPINEPTLKQLRANLTSKAEAHEKFETGLRLFRAGLLDETDLAAVVINVNDYYRGSLRQRLSDAKTSAFDPKKGEQNYRLRDKVRRMLIDLAPEHPSVHPALATLLAASSYDQDARDIIDYANQHGVRDPVLVKAIHDFAAKDSDWFARGEAVKYLGENAPLDDKAITRTLKSISQLPDKPKGSQDYLRGIANGAIARLADRAADSRDADRIALLTEKEDPAQAAKEIGELREVLRIPELENEGLDKQLAAFTRLHVLGQLMPNDFEKVAKVVNKIFWRYHTPGPSKAPHRFIETLLALMPTHPEVVPMLARATEDGWGYPAQDIAVAAMKHEVRDPVLMNAFRSFISSGIEDRFKYDKVIEALGKLGDKNQPRLLETLRRKAEFRYSGREPEKTSYAAAIALAHLGANDKATTDLLKRLMRDNEKQFYGSGVPFAAALALMGEQTPEAERLLERETTYDPNGRREHVKIAREALAVIPKRGSASSPKTICNPKALEALGRTAGEE